MAWGLQQSRQGESEGSSSDIILQLKRKQIGVHSKDFLKQSSYQLSCISSLRCSQLSKPKSPWGKNSGKEKNLGLNMGQKNSSPVVCHRRPSHSEFNKGSTWETKCLSGTTPMKAFLKHSLNLKDGSEVSRSSIKLTFK